MTGSWEACVNVMTPLGLHHIMQADFHYGPGPDYSSAPRTDWNSVYYHRADSDGLGFDRSSTGSNATGQYFRPLRDLLDNLSTCPEKYLLWFHHVGWSHPMKSGRAMWDELCSRYDSGLRSVDEMIKTWDGLKGKIDPEVFEHVRGKLEVQRRDAGVWRDKCIRYFQKFSRMPVLSIKP
jgi:alpha-glucuronidase